MILTGLLSVAGDGLAPGLIDSILEVAVVCAVAGVLGQFFKLPFVPILLMAGVVVGPYTLGIVSANSAYQDISQVAIIIMLFAVGLEIDLRLNFWAFIKDCLIGAVACLLCVLLIAGCLLLVNYEWQTAVTLGMALSLSSTAVVIRILARSKQFKTQFGRLSLSILVTQDILVLGMLAGLPFLAGTLSANSVNASSQIISEHTNLVEMFLNLGLVVIIIAGLKRALPYLMSIALKERTPDIVLFVGIALALCIAKTISWLGFSIEIGAFAAGLVLASTKFRYQLGSQLAPFKEFFLGVFFLTVGMQLGVGFLLQNILAIFGLVILLLTCKVLCITISCLIFNIPRKVSILTGFCLAQAGEFGLILLQSAMSKNLLNDETYSLVLASVIISLIFTPALLWMGEKIAELPLFHRANQNIKQDDDFSADADVILIGYGPAGRRVVEYMQNSNIAFHIIELNVKTLKKLKEENISASLGDATQPDILEHSGISSAKCLVIAVPDENIAMRIAAVAKSLNSNIQIISRLVHESQLPVARQLMLEVPVVEETLVGAAMVEALQAMLSVPASSQVPK